MVKSLYIKNLRTTADTRFSAVLEYIHLSKDYVDYVGDVSSIIAVPPENEGVLKHPTYDRTYSRWLKDEKRRERWWETCKRVVNYSLSLYQGPALLEELKAEALLMFTKMYNHKVFPSGRAMWIGGTEAVEKWPEAAFNCSFLVVKEIEDFCEVFYLLLCGAGVGFGVSKNDVEQLPRLNPDVVIDHAPYERKRKKDRLQESLLTRNYEDDFLTLEIGDSKEAWVDALRKYFIVLQSSEYGRDKIRIVYDNIRPKGERLHTFGGRAAGHKGLKEMFVKLDKVIKAAGGYIDSVVAVDICNIIAANVVVGGTRRSAQIALGSPGDIRFYDCKLNLYPHKKINEDGSIDFGPVNPEIDHRQMSNNTVVFESKPSREEVHSIFQRIKINGDPGFFNLEAALKRRPNVQGMNPCFAAGTMVMTREGHFPIESLVGKTVEIWDGEDWREINNFRVTAKNQEVYEVLLNSGQSVKATAYHSFILEDGTRKQLKNLQVGDRLLTHEEEVHGTHHEPSAYLKGFMVADGSLTKEVGGNPLLWIYASKYGCIDRIIQSADETTATSFRTSTIVKIEAKQDAEGRCRLTGLSARRVFDSWCGEYKKSLPIQEMLNWDLHSKCEFIAGIMDGDGTASDTKNGFMYQIASINQQALLDLQLLLRSIGVKCKVAKSKKAQLRDFGAKGGVLQCQDLYRLTISQRSSVVLAHKVKFSRLVSFADKKVSYVLKNKEAIVSSITPVGAATEVYCCTVEGSHSFSLSNGLVVGQCAEILLDDNGVCNLSTVNVYAHIKNGLLDLDDLRKSFRLATRIGVRQTNVTLSLPHWDSVQKRDRLTGVSLTGYMDALDFCNIRYDSNASRGMLSYWKQLANEEATRYSYEMRIPRPLLVTAVKPEGSLSLLPSVSCGIHRGYAPYFLRRISIADMDPIAKALKDLGVPVEEDITKVNSGRLKFVFPVKTNAKIAANDEPARDQLNRYLIFQKHYTDHNTSCTITIGKDEWEEIANLVYDNWDDIVACAFLSKIEDSHPQLPYQRVSKEVYEEWAAKMPKDMSKLDDLISFYEGLEEFDHELDEGCSAGVCPPR